MALPFLTVAVRAATGVEDSFRYGGDQAVTGLAVHEASHLERWLGPYSRYGWSHPGPLWFYLMAPISRLLGGDDAALIAANVLVNGALAAAVVVAASRARRPAFTLAVAALVLLFVLRMPPEMFVDAWSPYVLLMGTLLFLVLAAGLHTGSWPGLFAMLIAGSLLVQAHVGTAPLVAVVTATGGIALYLARRGGRGAADPADAVRSRRWTIGLAALLVAVWLPPLLEQVSARPLKEGNLARLVSFFLHHEEPGGNPTLAEAVVAVGRLISMTPYGWDTGPLEMDVDGLPVAVALALTAQVLASAGLVALGVRWSSRPGTWWGVVTLVALAAAIGSAVTVTGTLYWYLVVWVSVLPVATAIGWAHLLLERRAVGRERRPVLVGLTVVAAAGTVAAAASLVDVVADLPESTEVTDAYRLVEAGLADVEERTVRLDMQPHELWPVGAGVVRGLVSDGWTVTVDPEFANIFHDRGAAPGTAPVDLVLVSTGGAEHERVLGETGAREVGTFASQYGEVSVLVRDGG
ncbi:hypothetical protein [Blastococcus sp. CCUG 61487]|uniref:hypothetical protein n=1 Tax=Blastococcus sp. CCUG 61487 TaxID=1840703 RepID=UPI0010BFD0C1|nr:hypothetical protein [Blastococcus sp. CCUG 61487]